MPPLLKMVKKSSILPTRIWIKNTDTSGAWRGGKCGIKNMACVEIIPLSVDGVWRKSWENTSLPYCTLNNSKNPPLERNCFRHVRCWTEKWRRAHFRKFSSHDFRACVGLLWSPRKAENVLNDKVRRCRLVRVGLGDFKSLPISFKNVNFRPFVLMLAGNVNTRKKYRNVKKMIR